MVAWANLQDAVTGNLLIDIEIDGKTEQLSFPQVRSFASSSDAALKKKGYETELANHEKTELSSAEAINVIKGEVILTSRLRGYSSPLEQMLKNSRMNEKILDFL